MSRIDRRDAWLALLAFTVTVGYLALVPPVLVAGDEANYLHEAKRVARGEVLYRDVFELTTPAWVFLVAVLFRLFGTDIATAKTATAVLHGLTGAMLFLTCRITRVRRALAWPIALLYLAIAVPAWPMASQHWLAAMLGLALVLACAWLRGEPPATSLVPGVIAGLLVATHQRGVVLGAGVAAWLVADRVLVDRAERQPGVRRGVASLSWFLLGSCAVLAPLTLYLLVTAGGRPLWQALIVHPLFHYHGRAFASWGQAGYIASAFSFPTLLKYAPTILLVPILRLGTALRPRVRNDTPVASPHETSLLLLSTIVAGTAVASIQYYPDSAHIAFNASFFLLVLAQSLEAGVRRLPDERWLLRGLGWVAVVVLLAITSISLGRNLRVWRGLFPLRKDTAFGRVAMGTIAAEQLDDLRARLRRVSNPSLFGFPGSASHLCLMTDARNPTRYEFFSYGYNAPEQITEVLATLANDPPTYFILNGPLPPAHPMKEILDRDYTTVFEARGMGQFTILEPRDGARSRRTSGG